MFVNFIWYVLVAKACDEIPTTREVLDVAKPFLRRQFGVFIYVPSEMTCLTYSKRWMQPCTRTSKSRMAAAAVLFALVAILLRDPYYNWDALNHKNNGRRRTQKTFLSLCVATSSRALGSPWILACLVCPSFHHVNLASSDSICIGLVMLDALSCSGGTWCCHRKIVHWPCISL